uniref:Sel1-like protein n=1 Tax=Tanacetum cinerariifolium TaxID=118510 RepID=A0A6L2K4R4_TANCI|nr:sel1-like protein [Tanacetum cinerariifolium]
MILAQIELLIERTLIHDARNKGFQRNQQAFYYLEKAAYQLQPGALYLMEAIYLTDKCVKKDIAPTLSFKDRLLFLRYLIMVIELEYKLIINCHETLRIRLLLHLQGHSEPKELPVFESYIVEAEEGSDKKLHIRANVLHGLSHYHSRGCLSSADNTIHEVQSQAVTMRFNKSFEAIWTTCSEVSKTIYYF